MFKHLRQTTAILCGFLHLFSGVAIANESCSVSERQALYHAEKKEALPAMVMNIVPLGFGSYHQGDQVTGIVLSTIDGISLGLMFSGFLGGTYLNGNWGALVLMGYGFYGLVAGRAIGLTAPWIYAHFYNENLKRQLSHSSIKSNTQPMTVPLFAYSTHF